MQAKKRRAAAQSVTASVKYMKKPGFDRRKSSNPTAKRRNPPKESLSGQSSLQVHAKTRLWSLPAGLLLFVALYYSDSFGSPYQEIFLIGASTLIAIVLFAVTADYITCALSQSMGLLFSLSYYIYLAYSGGRNLGTAISFEGAFRIGLVWFSGLLITVFIRLFARGKWDSKIRRASFGRAFHLTSIVFLAAYASLLILLFITQRKVDLNGVRSLNLIPLHGAFAIYWPHIKAGEFTHGIFIQFFGNLFIFTPLGFYLGVYGKKAPKALAFFLPMILSGAIECTQYVLNMGKSDIDDFWMNVVGFWIGYFLYCLLGWVRQAVTKGKEKNIC